jgi:hypothetical protein
MVAVSGAGKTRRIYEELYSRPGIFFTCQQQGNGGSRDLGICIDDCIQRKDPIYFKAVVISRVMIIRWMIKNGITEPSSLSLAQIHPEKVFGVVNSIPKMIEEKRSCDWKESKIHDGFRIELLVWATYVKECERNKQFMREIRGPLYSSLYYFDYDNMAYKYRGNTWLVILPDAFAGMIAFFLF